MNKYIFLTNEGYTFQPNSNDDLPNIENMQVIGFSFGNSPNDAFNRLIKENIYLTTSNFNEIFSLKLDDTYEQSKKTFFLKEKVTT